MGRSTASTRPIKRGWHSSQTGSPAERLAAARAGIEELIDRVLERTGYDLAVLRMPGGPRRLANVRKLMRLAREHEAAHGPDLRGFLELVARRAGGAFGADRAGERAKARRRSKARRWMRCV